MDQPVLDQRLGTVGAHSPCCSRTATHLVTHYRYSRKRQRQAATLKGSWGATARRPCASFRPNFRSQDSVAASDGAPCNSRVAGGDCMQVVPRSHVRKSCSTGTSTRQPVEVRRNRP